MPAEERVVDASAMAALLFNESTAALVRKRLAGAALFAPDLLTYELANVYMKKKAQRPLYSELYLAGLLALQDLSLTLVPVAPGSAAQFADMTGLSAYDASYLAIAVLHRRPLVTLDERLAKAARKLKVHA